MEKSYNNSRITTDYIIFVKTAMARDNYTCQCCGRNANVVHHLDGYNWCVDKRTDPTNGICLCNNCHDNFHMIYGRGDNTKEQFENWIGETVTIKGLGEIDLPTARKIYSYEEDKIYESVKHFASEHNIKNETNIYAVCNHKEDTNSICKTIDGLHLFWLEEYKNLTNDQIEFYLKTVTDLISTPVYCIELDKTFRSSKEAQRETSVGNHSILCCCKKIQPYTRANYNGYKRLHWIYASEKDSLTESLKQEILNSFSPKGTPVINLITLEIFEYVRLAEMEYNTFGISNVCNKTQSTTRRTAGKLKNGTKCIWMKYEDYLNASELDILNALSVSFDSRPIYCLTTNERFKSIFYAIEKYPYLKKSGLLNALNNRTNYSGRVGNEKNGARMCWVWYDKYIHMSEYEILLKKYFIRDSMKSVICLNDGTIYPSAKIAAIKFGLSESGSSITNCCINVSYSSGFMENGDPAIWMYLDDYKKASIDSINEKLNYYSNTKNNTQVILLNTKEVFNNIREANKKYPQSRQSSISSCCSHKYKSAGKDENGEKMVWFYLDEYNKLYNQNIIKLINKNDYNILI